MKPGKKQTNALASPAARQSPEQKPSHHQEGNDFFFFFFFGLQGNCLFSVSKKLPQTPDEPDLC